MESSIVRAFFKISGIRWGEILHPLYLKSGKAYKCRVKFPSHDLGGKLLFVKPSIISVLILG